MNNNKASMYLGLGVAVALILIFVYLVYSSKPTDAEISSATNAVPAINVVKIKSVATQLSDRQNNGVLPSAPSSPGSTGSVAPVTRINPFQQTE